jgi:succinate dehydrogenase/fumarate reductase flavoprotein subunit
MVARNVPVPLGRFGAVPVAAAVALVLGGCAQGTLDRRAVRLEAQTVASAASEGALISDQTVRGRMKESFAQVEAADLADQAAKSQQDLEPALTTPDLKSTVEHLQSVAEDTSTELRALETDPRNLDRIKAVAERLGNLRDAASKVSDQL